MPHYVKKPIPIFAVQMDEPFTVETLEGRMSGKAGDYLVTGVRGEQYPCDKAIFEESYEEVSFAEYAESFMDELCREAGEA